MTLAALALLAAAAAQAGEPARLELRFIGNMAYAITDGKTTLYTDFPYQSGYSEYMTYDIKAVPKAPGSLCLMQVIVYHQTADETVPPLQGRKLPKQGESFTLEGVSAAGAPR